MSVDSLLRELQCEISANNLRLYREAYDDGADNFRSILVRLVECADNGYDTQTLHDIVADARKSVGR